MKNETLFEALARVETQSIFSPKGEEMLVISRQHYQTLLEAIEDIESLTTYKQAKR